MPAYFSMRCKAYLISSSQLMLLSLLLCFTCLIHADPNKNSLSASNNTDIKIEMLDAKLAALNSNADLSEPLKNKLQNYYERAKQNLSDLNLFKSKIIAYQNAIQEVPLKIKALQIEITRNEQRLKAFQSENFQAIPSDELEQRYLLEQGKLTLIDDEIKKVENEIQLQNNRPLLLRNENAASKEAWDKAKQAIEETPIVDSTPLENEARLLELKTTINARSSELKMQEFELLSNPIRGQLLAETLKNLQAKHALLEPMIKDIDTQLAIRRQVEANKVSEELSQTEKELADKPKIIRGVTQDNIKYSRDIQALTLKLEQFNLQKTLLEQQATAVQENFKSADKKISLAGLSPALGKILRDQRRNLVFKDDFYQSGKTLQNETAASSLEQFTLEDKIKQLSDIDKALKQLLIEQVDLDLPNDQRLRIKAELRVLLNTQKDLLNKLSNLYINYLRALGDIDFARQQLISRANEYASYLDKRLLWVPSSLALNLDFPQQVYASCRWLFSPKQWLNLAKESQEALINQPMLGLAAVLSLIFLQICKTKLNTRLRAINESVSNPASDSIKLTLKSLSYTLFLVAPPAFLLFYLGWFLNGDMNLSSFSRSVGLGLKSAAIPLFFLRFFHNLFAAEGIARKHFAWRKNATQIVRKQFQVLIYSIIPCTFLISMTGAYEDVKHTDTLGRGALIISLLAICYVLAQLLSSKAELFPANVRDDAQHWLNKLRIIWYPCILLIPIIIIGFAVSGYYLSALELQEKLIISLRIIFTAIIIHELVIRWLSLINRQLASQNSQHLQSTADSETIIDIPSINAQTIQILHAAIAISLLIGDWMVWKNILPAFAFLDQVVLWQHKVVLDAVEVYQPTTLTNLIFALIYAVLAYITVKNLPGLMELVIFRRFDIAHGSRYAVNQLCKYTILTVTLITVSNELGGNWAQVQWLAAALGVGLGFGLQEIFANLVSGIILLFERPIRVGDTITVGEITGTVNRIQMRATTLIDGDQKELIVPNKTFITSQLVNWTLTDSVTRVVIPVRIAYGSDIELAQRVMLESILTTPQVLTTPEPSVLFIGFGDSALNFSIRIFVGHLAERLTASHEIHIRLEQNFRKHNIVIPFPQREIHIQQ